MFKILNPVNGGNPFCSDKRAARYLRQGRAVLAREFVIRFVETDHRHKKAEMTALEAQLCVGYDVQVNSGRLTQRQAKGIPFAGYIGRMGLSA